MKVLLWGTSDKGKPRNRILPDALRAAGAEVSEIHHDLWQGIEDKSQLRASQRALRYIRALAAYPVLLLRFMTAPRPDAIYLAYPAPIDALVIWPAARLRGVPILLDLFLSIYDTTIVDRVLAKPGSLKARLLWGIEWLACRAADRVILDTGPHARYIEELFHLPAGTVGNVPVGVEADRFPRHPPARPGTRPRILFYGQLIPLQGIDTVLKAALSSRGEAFDWVIIGSGQDSEKLTSALGDKGPSHMTWIDWVPYSELNAWIGRSDICLGVFGRSRKAGSVVPNKAYQCLSSGRHVVTRASPAMDELLSGTEPGITLVEAGSSEALLDGIEAAIHQGCPPPSPALLDRFSSETIGTRLIDYLRALR